MTDTERKGDWQQTFTGRQFWPCDPRPEDVCIEDIAHALSMQCRFAGHCRTFYSVAEHSVRVSWYIESRTETLYGTKLAGLLHDATEAYCVDVPRPLKRHLVGYAEIEGRLARVIEQWAGLAPCALDAPTVKRADETLLITEQRDLMGPAPALWTFAMNVVPLAEVIVPWSQERAEHEFMARYNMLKGRLK